MSSYIIIASILTKIYNSCVLSGSFPDAFKIAEIIPIYKKGPKDKCCNYRPISLLQLFSKIFQKCLFNQFHDYLIYNILIYKQQYGFVEKSSTDIAVSQVCDAIAKNLDEGNTTCSAFLDLAKHFYRNAVPGN